MDHYIFRQMIFLTLVGIAYHPRNVITDDAAALQRCLTVALMAADLFDLEVQ